MLSLLPALASTQPLRLLCIGAHSDDIEIGCGGTLMSLLGSSRPVHITWLVLSALGERGKEARASAEAILQGASSYEIVLSEFRDGFFPSQYEQVKGFIEKLKQRIDVDVVVTHRLEDRHQDHRVVAELTWNTWRNQVVFEYEILKYEGDLGQPNVFVPLTAETARRKADHLTKYFGSQRSKDWFVADNFLSLARLRGIECRAPDGFAEGFQGRKLVFSPRAF